MTACALTSPAGYKAWAGSDALPAQRDLERACCAVDQALASYRYATDPAGVATDPGVQAAITKAVYFQLDAILTVQQGASSSAGGGVPPNLASASINGVSYTFRESAAPQLADLVQLNRLVPNAAMALRHPRLIRWVSING